jgi:hypothetical protein
VKGAIRAACGVDHTIVLVAASIPPLPHTGPVSLHLQGPAVEDPAVEDPAVEVEAPRSVLSLKELCEQSVAQSVHLHNVVSLLNFAAYYSCSGLFSFALQFILRLVICSPSTSLPLIQLTETWTLFSFGSSIRPAPSSGIRFGQS